MKSTCLNKAPAFHGNVVEVGRLKKESGLVDLLIFLTPTKKGDVLKTYLKNELRLFTKSDKEGGQIFV